MIYKYFCEIYIDELDIYSSLTSKMKKSIHEMDYEIFQAMYFQFIDFNYDKMLAHFGTINYYLSIAIFHHYKTEDYKQAEIYYYKAVQHNNEGSTTLLGLYFKTIGNHSRMLNNYLNTKNDKFTSYLLGCYYLETSNINAEKYLLGAERNKYSFYKLGCFYKYMKQYNKMEIYYICAAEHNHVDAMICLGDYYSIIKNYNDMKKYYKMAIKNGSDDAGYKMGKYFSTKKKYKSMERYYKKAIKSGEATYELGKYYCNICEYDKMEKYMLLSINNGNYNAAIFLALHIQQTTCDWTEIIKYYKIGADNGDIVSMYNLGKYYERNSEYDKMKEYYLMYIVNANKGTYIKKYRKNNSFMSVNL